jgi:all-trans-8'-apo-beta-carotenal 15,15'-oxygenase
MTKMMNDLSRRGFLGASAIALGAAAAGPALAKPAGDWRIGFRTPTAQGLGPARMRRVSGRMPKGFSGTLYRNGPAQLTYGTTPVGHWFDGDGMVHRIRFGEGEVMHAARFVGTPKRKAEQAAGKFLSGGFGSRADPSFVIDSPDATNAANTSVMMAGGELLALWEAGSAWRVDPVTLESRAPKVWREDLAGMPFLAHPKREPDGRVWNLAMGAGRIGVYRISPSGDLEDFTMVETGVTAYLHDFAITETKILILLQPWVAGEFSLPFISAYRWRPEQGLRVLILDKADLSKRRWAQAPARAFYHTGGAWEDTDGTIRVDAVFYPEPVLGMGGAVDLIRGESTGPGFPTGRLSMLEIPPAGDARIEETLLGGEFPQVDPRRQGLSRRLTAIASEDAPGRPGATALSVFDWDTGATSRHRFGASHIVEEHLFVPKPGGTGESDAWLVGTALNLRAAAMEVSIFDAARLGDGPVGVWRADYAWPLGFHGTWAP